MALKRQLEDDVWAETSIMASIRNYYAPCEDTQDGYMFVDECTSCMETFDRDKHVRHVFNECWHAICSACIVEEKTCPLVDCKTDNERCILFTHLRLSYNISDDLRYANFAVARMKERVDRAITVIHQHASQDYAYHAGMMDLRIVFHHLKTKYKNHFTVTTEQMEEINQKTEKMHNLPPNAVACLMLQLSKMRVLLDAVHLMPDDAAKTLLEITDLSRGVWSEKTTVYFPWRIVGNTIVDAGGLMKSELIRSTLIPLNGKKFCGITADDLISLYCHKTKTTEFMHVQTQTMRETPLSKLAIDKRMIVVAAQHHTVCYPDTTAKMYNAFTGAVEDIDMGVYYSDMNMGVYTASGNSWTVVREPENVTVRNGKMYRQDGTEWLAYAQMLKTIERFGDNGMYVFFNDKWIVFKGKYIWPCLFDLTNDEMDNKMSFSVETTIRNETVKQTSICMFPSGDEFACLCKTDKDVYLEVYSLKKCGKLFGADINWLRATADMHAGDHDKMFKPHEISELCVLSDHSIVIETCKDMLLHIR